MLDDLVSNTIQREVYGVDEAARDKKFKPYHILVDYIKEFAPKLLNINFTDEEILKTRLFYIGLKMIDDDIDESGFEEDKLEIGKNILSIVTNKKGSNELTTNSEYVYQALGQIGKESDSYLNNFTQLYLFNENERKVNSMEEYIKNRINVGVYTAKVSVDITRPNLFINNPKDVEVYQKAMAFSCLIDSVMDYKRDLAEGAFSFEPRRGDYRKLVNATFRSITPLVVKFPKLLPEVFNIKNVLKKDNIEHGYY